MGKLKTALVTGANKGIGFEISRQLAKRGFHVYLTARNRELGTKACAHLQGEGLGAQFIQMDVSSLKSIEAAAKELSISTNHLDVLVNNAGILEDENLSGLQVSPEIVLRTFETNALGALIVAQKFWPQLAKSGGGRIINISSGLGSLSDMEGGYPAYRISKAALNAVTRILAAELADKGISVNSVSPGWVRTDMGGANATLSPEEAADSILWLAVDAPQHLSGSFLQDRKIISW